MHAELDGAVAARCLLKTVQTCGQYSDVQRRARGRSFICPCGRRLAPLPPPAVGGAAVPSSVHHLHVINHLLLNALQQHQQHQPRGGCDTQHAPRAGCQQLPISTIQTPASQLLLIINTSPTVSTAVVLTVDCPLTAC